MTGGGAVVVTGSSGGIGEAIVTCSRRLGWTTFGLDRRSPSNESRPDRFLSVDVAEANEVATAFEEIAGQVDSLAGLVNNAAIQRSRAFEDTDVSGWDEVVAANLRSVYLCTRCALPLLRADPPGAIVNVSSVHAVATSKGLAPYAASKGGVSALTRALAVELGASGIRVNSVLPGAVDTAMLRAGLDRGHVTGGDTDANVGDLGERHALGRVGTPAEIAEAVVFFLDPDRASFVTGASLAVDGGALARLSTE